MAERGVVEGTQGYATDDDHFLVWYDVRPPDVGVQSSMTAFRDLLLLGRANWDTISEQRRQYADMRPDGTFYTLNEFTVNVADELDEPMLLYMFGEDAYEDG